MCQNSRPQNQRIRHTLLAGLLATALSSSCSLGENALESEAQSLALENPDAMEDAQLVQLDKCLTSNKTRIDLEAYVHNRPKDFYTTCITKSEICPAILTTVNDYEPEMYREYPPIFVYADVPGSMKPFLVGSKAGSEVYAADVDVFNTGKPERIFWVLWSLGVKYPGLMVGINPDAEDPPMKFTARELRAGKNLFPKLLSEYVWRHESGIKWVGTTLIKLDSRAYLAAVSPARNDQPALLSIFEMNSADHGELLCQFTSSYSVQEE